MSETPPDLLAQRLWRCHDAATIPTLARTLPQLARDPATTFPDTTADPCTREARLS